MTWNPRIRQRLLILWTATLLICALGASVDDMKENRGTNMEKIEKLLRDVYNPDLSPMERVGALRELAQLKEKAVVNDLKRFLSHPAPGLETVAKGYDPAGEDRVVKLHAIATLHELGDDSELTRIRSLVANGEMTLQGPEDESRNAALVVLSIGRLGPLELVVELCNSRDSSVIRNAVRTLNRLDLPMPAAAGPIEGIAQLSEPISFEIRRFSEELETIERLSRGSIVLSKGTKSFLQSGDYDRGSVKREGVTLAEVVEQDMEMLNLCYYVDNGKVIVCLFEEAAERWRNWWQTYGKRLIFDKASGRFILGR